MNNCVEKLFCNGCKSETRHAPISALVRRDYSDNNYRHYEEHQLFECLGCESIQYRVTENSDGCEQTEYGQVIPGQVFYPPATIRSRPVWLGDLMFPISFDEGPINGYLIGLMDEIYTALQSGSSRLSAMGIRALLEHIMVKHCGDQGSFKKNISAFEEQGLVSKVQRKALESVLEIGHAAIHRGHKPTTCQLRTALDITENIVEAIYVVAKKSDSVVKGVPERDFGQTTGGPVTN